MPVKALILMKDWQLQGHNSQQKPREIKRKRLTVRYIIIELLKDKAKKQILKTGRGKKIHYT